jgi:hypothetical protein
VFGRLGLLLVVPILFMCSFFVSSVDDLFVSMSILIIAVFVFHLILAGRNLLFVISLFMAVVSWECLVWFCLVSICFKPLVVGMDDRLVS